MRTAARARTGGVLYSSKNTLARGRLGLHAPASARAVVIKGNQMKRLWCLWMLAAVACWQPVSELECFDAIPCPTGYICQAGLCLRPIQPCNASTCAGCCSNATTCLPPASQTDQACGLQAACALCQTGSNCKAGVCVSVGPADGGSDAGLDAGSVDGGKDAGAVDAGPPHIGDACQFTPDC